VGKEELGNEKLGRESICASWALFSEWWCVPVDQTEEEKQEMLIKLRTNLSSTFAKCPLEYIEDRLFGGIACNDDPNRRHVNFYTGGYSHMAAEEGRYRPLDRAGSYDRWQEILKGNAEYLLGDGPFTKDFPKDFGEDNVEEK